MQKSIFSVGTDRPIEGRGAPEEKPQKSIFSAREKNKRDGWCVSVRNKRMFLIAVFIVAVILCVWYFAPTHFLSGTKAEDVKAISVFDGGTGKAFEIKSADEIQYIVENIRGAEMKRGKLSVGYKGYRFRMTFCDVNGKKIESFYINSDDTIRKDPFFYSCDGDLCYEFLEALER